MANLSDHNHLKVKYFRNSSSVTSKNPARKRNIKKLENSSYRVDRPVQIESNSNGTEENSSCISENMGKRIKFRPT